MNAVYYQNYGPPEVLRLKQVEPPVPQDNEVMIKVHAAEVTKADCELRSFKFPVKWFWLPLRIALGPFKPRKKILGGYFAGEVVETGKAVETYQIGDAVFGSAGLRMGAYGQYMCLPATSNLVAKPSNLSYVEAAAVPLGGLNALHFMRKAQIQPGERALINGAGGSIGIFAVQLAKIMGAEVTAVDASHKEAIIRSVGADHFIDYQKQDYTQMEIKYHVIFDMVVSSSYSDNINSLLSQGRYLMGNPRLSDMLRSFFTEKTTDKKVTFAFAAETPEELQTLKEMIEGGEIKPVVDKVYYMDQVVEAHRRVETEQRMGSVVLKISD